MQSDNSRIISFVIYVKDCPISHRPDGTGCAGLHNIETQLSLHPALRGLKLLAEQLTDLGGERRGEREAHIKNHVSLA